MELIELTRGLDPRTPGGFVVTVVLILVVGSGLFSKAAADYGGMLGSAARWLQRRKEAAVEADELSKERRVDRLVKTVGRLEREIADMHAERQATHAYEIYVVEFWREQEMWAAERGFELKPPPMKPFPTWRKEDYSEDED